MKILCNLLPTVIEILFKPIFMLLIQHNMLFPAAVRSEARVCARSPAEIVGSNPDVGAWIGFIRPRTGRSAVP